MLEQTREKHIQNMTNSLPVLRIMLHLSQLELARVLDISRQQIVFMETKKRKMSWTTFLALVLLFNNNAQTRQLLPVLGIYTPELEASIRLNANHVEPVR